VTIWVSSRSFATLKRPFPSHPNMLIYAVPATASFAACQSKLPLSMSEATRTPLSPFQHWTAWCNSTTWPMILPSNTSSWPSPNTFPAYQSILWLANLGHALCQMAPSSPLTPMAQGLFLLSSPLVQEYLSCCLFLLAAAFPLVNWPAIGYAFATSPPLFHLWISKFVSGHSAIGCMMFKKKEWDNDLCPCCGHSPETTWHVITCQDPCMSAAFASALLKFSSWVQSSEMHPSISSCFMATLSSLLPPGHPVLPLCRSHHHCSSAGTRLYWVGELSTGSSQPPVVYHTGTALACPAFMLKSQGLGDCSC